MRRPVMTVGILVCLVALTSASTAQDPEQTIAPETRVEVGEVSGLATPLGPPASVPVQVVIGCHPDETPETTTRVALSVDEPPGVRQAVISPSNASYVTEAGACPNPDRRHRVNATLVVGAGPGPAFEEVAVHVQATVVRELRQGTTWSHGPYHANATIERGFSPAANVTLDPPVVEADAGSTAIADATIENLSNGVARIAVSVRVDGPGDFHTRADPEVVELRPGSNSTVKVEVTDQRAEPIERPLSAKVIAHVTSVDPRATPEVSEQGTLRIHFGGEIPQAEGPLGVPGVHTLLATLLIAGPVALLARSKTT